MLLWVFGFIFIVLMIIVFTVLAPIANNEEVKVKIGLTDAEHQDLSNRIHRDHYHNPVYSYLPSNSFYKQK